MDGPQVAFPSQSPSMPTGPGAIVWVAGSCAGPAAPSAAPGAALSLAALGPTDLATAVSRRSLVGWSGAGLQAVGGSLGRVTVAVALQDPRTPTGGAVAVLQERATRPLGPPALLVRQESLPALTRAYLGDTANATVVPGPAIAVRLQRYFSPTFARARLIPVHAGPVTALTATMDYRADVLVAWQQDGAIYAHMLRASGRPDPTQRVGASAPNPQLRALVSDNDHGMIAWASTEASEPSQPSTRVYIDLSAAGVRFRAPQPLASFADPQRVCLHAGCLGLVRLSTENVMMAWTDAEHGHYVIRGAPAVFAATRPTTRISDPRGQAVLADLAAGPAGEAVALWQSAPPPGDAFDPRQTELWAARAHLVPHDRLAYEAPEMVAAAGPNLAPNIAVDPANDRAVAAWLTTRANGSIEYAVGFGAGGYHPRASAVPQPGGGTHWLRIMLAAGAAAAAVALLGLAAWRRRHPRGT
jgi:hypothetical protein